MRSSIIIKENFRSLALIIFIALPATSQFYHLDETASRIKVDGTSNIHDWTIISEDFQGRLTAILEREQLIKVECLEFVVPAESLKSGRDGMDKNTFKTLHAKKHKYITYNLEQVQDLVCNSGKCKFNTSGKLNVAGTKRRVEILFEAIVFANKIIITGNKEIKMSDHNIVPPTVWLGTITTGDAVTVSLKATFIR